jgi:hypothetical protein
MILHKTLSASLAPSNFNTVSKRMSLHVGLSFYHKICNLHSLSQYRGSRLQTRTSNACRQSRYIKMTFHTLRKTVSWAISITSSLAVRALNEDIKVEAEFWRHSIFPCSAFLVQMMRKATIVLLVWKKTERDEWPNMGYGNQTTYVQLLRRSLTTEETVAEGFTSQFLGDGGLKNLEYAKVLL